MTVEFYDEKTDPAETVKVADREENKAVVLSKSPPALPARAAKK